MHKTRIIHPWITPINVAQYRARLMLVVLIPYSTTDICCSFSRKPLSIVFHVLLVDIGPWLSEAHPSLSPCAICSTWTRVWGFHYVLWGHDKYHIIVPGTLGCSSCGGLSHSICGAKAALVALEPIKILQCSSVSVMWGSHVEFR